MRCKNCDYPLWNLPARKCPECGTDFRPSDFHFVPNSVKFHCPHCEQQYYGTTEHGHLVPRTFNCVKCAQRIDMDEMLLFPGDGVEESSTAVDVMPWLERTRLGFLRGWWRTVLMAMVSPRKLMRAIPHTAGSLEAWFFSLVSNVPIFLLGGVSSILVFGILMSSLGNVGGGPGGANAAGGMVMDLAGTIVAQLAGFIAVLALWGLSTHGLLRISGETPHGLGRTFQAILYSSAANIPAVIPCVGSCLQYFVWIWWMVSGILMVMQVQRTSGIRATLCVGAFPALCVTLLIALIAFFALSTTRMTSNWSGGTVPVGTYAPMSETSMISTALRAYAAGNNGVGPTHGIELVANNQLPASAFAIWQIGHDEANVMLPGAGITLGAYQFLPTNRSRITANTIVAAQPANVIAHRVGDVVFTHHGMNLNASNPGLWIAVICPDPDQPANPRAGNVGGPVFSSIAPIAIFTDGSVVLLTPDVASNLSAQNALRGNAGLPPLPDLTSIRNGTPALDASTSPP